MFIFIYSVCVCECLFQNNVKVHGLKEYVVTNIEEVTRVIFVGNSKLLEPPSLLFLSLTNPSPAPLQSIALQERRR